MNHSDALRGWPATADDEETTSTSGAARPGRPRAGLRQRLRRHLYQQILDGMETDRKADYRDPETLRARVKSVMSRQLQGITETALPADERRLLEEELVQEVGGMGPLAPLFDDPAVCDILVNGPGEVWVDRTGRLERTAIRFDDETHLRRVLDRIVAGHGRRIDEASPSVDVRLPDGSRVHAVIPPLSRIGTVVSIRRFRARPFHLDELCAMGTLDGAEAQFLVAAVRAGLNVLLTGGAATGKTTLLNVLASHVPPGERIVTIEETAELRIEHPHVLPLEARPPNLEGRGEVTLRTLVKNALRMRADRIVVGEVRGAEVLDMLQAMNIGHDGSLTTVHSNGADDALRRLESLALMGGEVPAEAIRDLLGSVFHVIVHLTRFADGTRRISGIHEVVAVDGEPQTRELFRYQRTGARGTGRHVATGHRPRFLDRLIDAGLDPSLLVATPREVAQT